MPGSKPKLKLPKLNFTPGDGPFVGGYAGGPNEHNASPSVHSATNTDGSGEVTIKPQATISPTPRAPAVVSIANVRQTVQEFSQPTDNITPDGVLWSDELLVEEARLGEGAGGAVYKVRDVRSGMRMARKSITTHEAPVKQLLREVKIAAAVKHKNIVSFYGAYMSPSSNEVKLLMELCEGGSLESVGKRMRQINARVSEKVAGRIAEGVLQGLDYLHAQKTIHRDIKPPNILLTRKGIVKLSDFGVSGELVNSNAGTFTGTSLYMAPERLSGSNYSIRSDVWSTGITLLELVQNRFPFPTDLADIELMMYITQNEPPELEDEDESDLHYSAEMKDFIKYALTRDPTVRPTPRGLLTHEWIINVMQTRVSMACWMREVWDWKKTKSDDQNPSRPGSSRSELSLGASMANMRLHS